MGAALVGFSPDMAEDLARLRLFQHQRMYRHYEVNRMRAKAERTLMELFDLFEAWPDTLPPEWSQMIDGDPARVICNYIAGMTDRYAIEEHRRLHLIEL
jgi:dGTPase